MAIEYHCDEPQRSPVRVSSESALAGAARNAEPGDYIQVVGNYDNDVVWRADGTEGKPIHLDFSKAKMKNMIFEIEGDWIRLTRGDWRASQVTIEGNHCRVSRCHFHDGKTGGNSDKFNSAAWITRTASYSRIDHCLVENWIGRGIRQSRVRQGARDNIMDQNHMRRMSDGDNRNGRECMQIGSSDEFKLNDLNTHILYNLIEDHDLESEIVSVKANGNVIAFNTALDCRIGYFVCRSGSRNKFHGNYMLNSRGIIIYGDSNELNGNMIVGNNSRSEIGIRSGDCNVDQLREGKYRGGHPAARDTLMVFNTCEVGGREPSR